MRLFGQRKNNKNYWGIEMTVDGSFGLRSAAVRWHIENEQIRFEVTDMDTELG